MRGGLGSPGVTGGVRGAPAGPGTEARRARLGAVRAFGGNGSGGGVYSSSKALVAFVQKENQHGRKKMQ